MAPSATAADLRLIGQHTGRVADDLTCEYDAGCGKPAAYGVSLSGERYRPTCWEHALFHAVPQARTITTVELAPMDWAFDDDASAGPPGAAED